jgi:hypothetical protein
MGREERVDLRDPPDRAVDERVRELAQRLGQRVLRTVAVALRIP